MRSNQNRKIMALLRGIIEKQKSQVEMCDHQIKKLCPSGELPNFREIDVPVEAALWFEVNLKNVTLLDISGLETVAEYLGNEEKTLDLLKRTYNALHRDHWEEGETKAELSEAILAHLDNELGVGWNETP